MLTSGPLRDWFDCRMDAERGSMSVETSKPKRGWVSAVGIIANTLLVLISLATLAFGIISDVQWTKAEIEKQSPIIRKLVADVTRHEAEGKAYRRDIVTVNKQLKQLLDILFLMRGRREIL